jgi:hypothetical protein
MMSARGNHFKPGTKFGRLTIIKETTAKRKGHRWYLCRCDCGKPATVSNGGLVNGSTKSCGCLYRQTRRTAGWKHGKSPVGRKIAVYSAYYRERSLCRNPNIPHRVSIQQFSGVLPNGGRQTRSGLLADEAGF